MILVIFQLGLIKVKGNNGKKMLNYICVLVPLD
jgi:hypothetical protein